MKTRQIIILSVTLIVVLSIGFRLVTGKKEAEKPVDSSNENKKSKTVSTTFTYIISFGYDVLRIYYNSPFLFA